MPFVLHEVGSHCMHHVGVLVVGMNPSLAQLGFGQERLHCMRAEYLHIQRTGLEEILL